MIGRVQGIGGLVNDVVDVGGGRGGKGCCAADGSIVASSAFGSCEGDAVVGWRLDQLGRRSGAAMVRSSMVCRVSIYVHVGYRVGEGGRGL